MTWLDLHNFLNRMANDPINFGKFDWNDNVYTYNADNGETSLCDTYYLGSQLVLASNMENNNE